MIQNNEIIRIEEILNEKIALFINYEEITDFLVKFDPDKAEDLIKQREKISNSIKKLNCEIKEICDNSPIGENIRDAMYNKIDWNKCESEFQNIYKNGQEIIACISRLKRKETSIKESIDVTKEKILGEIKKQNTGAMGNTAKYYRSTNPMGGQKFKLLDSKL